MFIADHKMYRENGVTETIVAYLVDDLRRLPPKCDKQAHLSYITKYFRAISKFAKPDNTCKRFVFFAKPR